MKLLFSFLLISIISLNLSADNLLKNGDFELSDANSEDVVRKSWGKIMYGYDLVTDSPQHGKYCIKCEKGGASYTYDEKMTPGEKLYLSFFARSKGFPANAPRYRNACVLLIKDANDKKIGREIIIGIKNSNNWKQYIKEIKIPAGAAKIIIKLMKYKHAGTTWIDNVSLSREVPKIVVGKIKPQTREEILRGVSKELIKKNRLDWLKKTEGENIALGRKVEFSVKPNYYLTRNIMDNFELTDGKLCEGRKDGAIWFSRDVVGLIGDNIAQAGVNLIIDLGKEASIDKVVARILAGGAQGALFFPSRVSLYASNDNKTYYEIKTLRKIQPGDNNKDGGSDCFEIEETGEPYVYALNFTGLSLKARYIGLNIKAVGRLMCCDEIAVIADRNGAKNVDLTKYKPALFFMKGIAMKNNTGKLVISSNIITPNYFQVVDQRGDKDRKNNLQFVFELPENITMLDNGYRGKLISESKILIEGQKYKRWITEKPRRNANRGIAGPFYFSPVPGSKSKAEKAYVYLKSPGYKSRKAALPIEFITIPEVPEFKHFSISLAWLLTNHLAEWPNSIKNLKSLGFNAVPTFWYNFIRGENSPAAKVALGLIAETRKAGMKVIYNDSPLHWICNKHKKNPLIYHQIPGRKSYNLCQSYRGELYEEEIKRVADGVVISKPDYVFYDIEVFPNSWKFISDCSRCRKEAEKRGISLDQLMIESGTEIMGDLHNAIEQACKKNKVKVPEIGFYANHPGEPAYHKVFKWTTIFSKGYVDFAMPSLYIRGNAKVVHDVLADNYRKLGNKRKSISWLTTGTYGEFPARKIEPMIYEVLFSGGSGFTYFAFQDFDSPLDFLYHAKALKTIQPYENILWNGNFVDLKSDNKNLTVSAWQLKNEMVMMVRNYSSKKALSANILLPFKGESEIKDIQTGKTVKGDKIGIKLNYLSYKLFHIKAGS
jgi:hypothetical protein